MMNREISIICIKGWRSVQGDGSERDEGSKEQQRGKFCDLLISVGHHRQGNVLAHVVQLISETVGAGNVNGGAVIMTLLNCKEQICKYFLYIHDGNVNSIYVLNLN